LRQSRSACSFVSIPLSSTRSKGVFDPGFARSCGTRTALWETALAVLSAVVIVIAMRLVGTLLVSALLVFPAVSAMRLCKSFRGVIAAAAALSVASALGGILVAIAAGTPVGATIVAVEAVVFAVCSARRR
jgi:zinc transport system permease protein